MEKKLACFPNWYKYSLLVAYMLPFPALVIYTVVVLWIGGGLWGVICAFMGSLLVGGMIFFPFFGMYYAAITFIHTLFHELIFRSCSKKKSAINILVSFVCSAFLALNSVWAIQYFEHKFGWVPLVLMPIGFFMIGAFFTLRVFFFFSPKQTKENEG